MQWNGAWPASPRIPETKGIDMKMGKWVWGVAMAAVLQMGAASAANDKPVVQATNKADFDAVAAAIRQQVAPGGRWEYTTKREREEINRRLNDMGSLFDKYGSIDQMNDPTKMQLVNDQEAVNEILTKRDDDHIVCDYEQPLGSLIPKKVCRTYGEIQRQRDQAQHDAYQRLATPQLRASGG
jgi:hypothetical protein